MVEFHRHQVLLTRRYGGAARRFSTALTRSSRPASASRTRVRHVTYEEIEAGLRARLDALGPARRAELLHVLMLPDFERADRIDEFWSYPAERTFTELLIDCEESDAVGRSPWEAVVKAG